MKVLPIKLPDETYTNLKRLAKSQRTSMASIIRQNLPKTTKKQTFLEAMAKYQYTGPNHRPNETDDEILYGGKLGNY